MYNSNKTPDDKDLINCIARKYFNLQYILPFVTKREGLRIHSELKSYINTISCLEERATWLQRLDAEKIKLDLKIS